MAYNIMAGGERLEDIELRRQDECFLNGLGAQRIPDPTTAGDFTRRFSPENIVDLMDAINQARQRVWQEQPEGFLAKAFRVVKVVAKMPLTSDTKSSLSPIDCC